MIVAKTPHFAVVQDGDNFYVRTMPQLMRLGTRLYRGWNRGDPPPLNNDPMERPAAEALMDAWTEYLTMTPKQMRRTKRQQRDEERYAAAMQGIKYQPKDGFRT